MSIVTRASFETGVHAHLQRPASGGPLGVYAERQKAGTKMSAGTPEVGREGSALNEEARILRTNQVLAELLKDGQADVSDLSIRDIVRLSEQLGWEGDPRLEFTDEGVFLAAPGRRRRKQERPQHGTVTQQPQATPPAEARG